MKEFLIGSRSEITNPYALIVVTFTQKNYSDVRALESYEWLDKGGQERPPRTLPLDLPLESLKTHVQSHCSAH